jgi:hypothetical protein
MKLLFFIIFMCGGLFFSDSTHAVKLELAPEAPVWAHFGAAALLYLHIAGGAVGSYFFA